MTKPTAKMVIEVTMLEKTKRTYSIAEAKTHLGRLVHQAEEGPPVELTRRGRPIAVVLSVRDYERLAQSRPSVWDAVVEFRRGHALDELNLDPEEIFQVEKDASPGRDFSW